MVGMAAMVLPLTLVEPYMSLTVLPFLGVVLFLNRKLFRFFQRARGFRFAVSAFPLQLLYFFYSGVIFATYWVGNCFPTRSANLFPWLEKWGSVFSRPSVPIDPLEVTLPVDHSLGDRSLPALFSDPLRTISPSSRSPLTQHSLAQERSVSFSTPPKTHPKKEPAPFDRSMV